MVSGQFLVIEMGELSYRKVVQRFLVPQLVVSLYYGWKYRAFVSSRAEVELSRNIQMGRGVTISSFAKIKATDGLLLIGKESGFGSGCFVSADAGGITIGDFCIFGPHVTIVSSNYAYERPEIPFKHQGSTSQGVRIGANVWVGAGTTILDGTVIGDNSIVVANSLLNRVYPPNSIIQGNPAKVILNRSQGERYAKASV